MIYTLISGDKIIASCHMHCTNTPKLTTKPSVTAKSIQSTKLTNLINTCLLDQAKMVLPRMKRVEENVTPKIM
jgi:hypothetical protein